MTLLPSQKSRGIRPLDELKRENEQLAPLEIRADSIERARARLEALTNGCCGD